MPIDPLVIIIFEFVISMLGIFLVSLPLLKKYHERKSLVTLLIFLATTLASVAGLVFGIGRILRFTGWWEIQPGVNLDLIAFTLAFIAISDLLFFAFALEVFRGGISRGINKVFLVFFVFAVFIFVVYDLATGLFEVDSTVEILLLLMGLTSIACSFLSYTAWKASHKFEKPVDRYCSKLIAIGPLLLLLSLVFQGIESALTYMSGGITQYSPFYFIGWILILLAVFMLSMGYLQPEWLKRRISGEKSPSIRV